MKSFLIIGVGRFGRHLATKLVELGNEVMVVDKDDYYLPRELQVNDENGVKNFDLPESIDIDAFTGDIRKLQQGEAI